MLVASAAVGGLFVGSFLGVLVTRVPAERGSVSGRSMCGSCGRTLEPRELVPILSWLWLKGRCGTCGAAIGAVPLLMEIGAGALFAATAAVSPDPFRFALVAPFLGVLLALSVIDLEHRRLPNRIVYPSALAAATLVVVADLSGNALSVVGAVIGAAAFGGGLLLLAVLSRGGMGLGDVKLAGLIGLVIGAVDLPSVGVAAGAAIIFGGLAAVVALMRGAGRRTALPFGPMLSAGALVAVTAGPQLAEAYMGLLR